MRILKILFYFISIFGMSFILTSCTTKKVVSLDRHKLKQLVKAQKDSLFEEKKQVVLEAFAWEKSHAFEMEIQSDKDSLGNSKEFSIEKIRSPTSEKIIVRGGSLKLKTTQHSADKITKKDTLRVNNTSVRTEIDDYKSSEKEDFKKEEDKKNTGFSFGFYFWLILILILLFLAWRLKLFRIFSVFKKYLNRN